EEISSGVAHHRADERVARANPIAESARQQPRGHSRDSAQRYSRPGQRQRDTPPEMEIDDQERRDEAVPEEVDQHSELEQPYLGRQLRIEDQEQSPDHDLQHTLRATYVAIDVPGG